MTTAREPLAHRLAAALSPFGLIQSSASAREIEELLISYLSFGPWAELAITVSVTRKDISRLKTPKAEQVNALLGFVADALKDLGRVFKIDE